MWIIADFKAAKISKFPDLLEDFLSLIYLTFGLEKDEWVRSKPDIHSQNSIYHEHIFKKLRICSWNPYEKFLELIGIQQISFAFFHVGFNVYNSKVPLENWHITTYEAECLPVRGNNTIKNISVSLTTYCKVFQISGKIQLKNFMICWKTPSHSDNLR